MAEILVLYYSRYGSTANLAAQIGPGLAKASVAAVVDGELRDLSHPLEDGAQVRLLTKRADEALEVLRHSAAHLMADAILRIFPQAQLTIGPVIEDGFYYDIYMPEETITPEDFAGTTGTITNPGMIGTVHSVPRLMPGQGFILGVGAIAISRSMMGATFGSKADAGTIRGDFGDSNSFNLIHGSDSPEAAERELGLFFNEGEVLDFDRPISQWVYDYSGGDPE